jgi:hypothetical protein
MKEISGNFIDLDAEEEDGRASLVRGFRQGSRRYPRPRARRRTLGRGNKGAR